MGDIGDQPVILDFCGGCGMLLPEGLGLAPVLEQVCENCGMEVNETDDRIQGTFTAAHAAALRDAYGQ